MPVIRVVCAVIVRDGRLFAARRGPAMSQAGLWELAGGKVEPGEADADALIREMREELGVDVRVAEQLGVSEYDYPTVRVQLVAYACTVVSGEPRAIEHDRLAWVGRDEARELDWAPADRPLIAVIAARLG